MKTNKKSPLTLSRETIKSLGVTSAIKTGVAGPESVTWNCSAYCQKTQSPTCGGTLPTRGCPM